MGSDMDMPIFSVHWDSLNDFFAMGGYGLYVWGSFVACALLFLIECVQAKRVWHEELNHLAQAYELDEGLARLREERS